MIPHNLRNLDKNFFARKNAYTGAKIFPVNFGKNFSRFLTLIRFFKISNMAVNKILNPNISEMMSEKAFKNLMISPASP